MKLAEDKLKRLLGSFKLAGERNIAMKAFGLKCPTSVDRLPNSIRGQWRIFQSCEAILFVKLTFAMPDQHEYTSSPFNRGRDRGDGQGRFASLAGANDFSDERLLVDGRLI